MTVHCWQDEGEYHGFGSVEWAASLHRGGGTCMLPDGHKGPHEFTPDQEITISFAGRHTEGQ